jgi:hypothetical protein
MIIACTAGFLLCAACFAQDKGTASKQSKEVQQDTKTMTADKTAKTSTDTVYGKVESYDPGKSIKVTVPGTIVSTKSFSLDDKNETINVASSVKVGEWVSVVEKTDNNGHKSVTVSPSSEKQAARASRVKKTNQ